MNHKADQSLEALFAAVRDDHIDTSRVEFGFETRLMARLREDRSPWSALANIAWRLCPFFAALALAAGWWCWTPGMRAEADVHLLAEATSTGEDHAMLAYLTGEER